jgi:hypothetical protein
VEEEILVMNTKIRERRRVCFFLQCWRIRFTAIVLLSLVATTALKVQGQNQQPLPGGASQPASGPANQLQQAAPLLADNEFFTPFPAPNYKSRAPAQPPSPAPPQPSAPPAKEEVSKPSPALPPPTLQSLKPKKNEVSVSGDFMFGEGQVTMPVGYSLKRSLNEPNINVPVSVIKPTRSSDYFGATVSYSYGQAWYFDFSYAHGHSSGNQTLNFQSLGSGSGSFSIDDDWYQAYIRYTFPQLRGKRLSAYLRAGLTYIQATLDDASTLPGDNFYTQIDKSTDIRGNFGAGLAYTVYSSRRFRCGLAVEGEGFYGNRSQDSLETLKSDYGLAPVTATINNTIYGGIGRAVVHFEYRFGRTGLFRSFLDAGGEADYTMVNYPSAGTSDELLWGPYVKLGLRYSF